MELFLFLSSSHQCPLRQVNKSDNTLVWTGCNIIQLYSYYGSYYDYIKILKTFKKEKNAKLSIKAKKYEQFS